MKIITKIMCGFVFLALISPSSCFAEKQWQIKDLYEQYNGQRWQESFQTARNETVTIDAPFIIPDVETAPVILVRAYPNLDASFEAVYTAEKKSEQWKRFARSRDGMTIAMGHDFEFSMNNPKDVNVKKSFQEQFVPAEEISVELFAENNPMNMRQALEIVTELHDKILNEYGASGSVPLMVEYAWTMGLYKEKTGEPLIDHRGYGFECKPVYRGFPLLSNVAHNFLPSYRTTYRWEGTYHAHANLEISAPDSYSIASVMRAEEKVLHEDIPLADFTKPQKKVTELIEKGLVRDVRKIFLAYIAYCESSHDTDKTGRWILVPTWVLDTDYYPSANNAENPYDSEEFSYFNRSGFHYLLFNAQNGSFLDPKDTSRNRSDAPKMVTWK